MSLTNYSEMVDVYVIWIIKHL